MLQLVVNLLFIRGVHCGKENLPVTPVDAQVGQQVVDLRLPLEMREGERFIVFARDPIQIWDVYTRL